MKYRWSVSENREEVVQTGGEGPPVWSQAQTEGSPARARV